MTTPTSIDETFSATKFDGRMAFMPFVTAGDPSVDATVSLLESLTDAGVDLIEIGFPYSDPIADGPVIQASYSRALDANTHVADIFAGVRRYCDARNGQSPPLLAMVSYAIMFRHGLEQFIEEAADAGFAGFIVPDLPGDEAGECFNLVRERGLDLVQLIAPTTPRERVRTILEHCSGFVYCIAVAGITGEREQLAEGLLEQLRWLREETELPLAVGFGISQPKHVEPLRTLADGVIVGSAIVRHLQSVADGDVSLDDAVEQVKQFASQMFDAVQA